MFRTPTYIYIALSLEHDQEWDGHNQLNAGFAVVFLNSNSIPLIITVLRRDQPSFCYRCAAVEVNVFRGWLNVVGPEGMGKRILTLLACAWTRRRFPRLNTFGFSCSALAMQRCTVEFRANELLADNTFHHMGISCPCAMMDYRSSMFPPNDRGETESVANPRKRKIPPIIGNKDAAPLERSKVSRACDACKT
jgi:hypothetical protein